jgi:hypothetical protein
VSPRAGVAILWAAVFLGAPPAALLASGKSRVIRFTAGNRRVRAVVPEVFEPLLPGSVYPNRRQSKPWSGGTVIVLERSLVARAEPFLLARGLLAAEVEGIDEGTVDAIADELSRRIEGGIGAVELLARSAGDALSSRHLRSAALLDPGALPETRPSLPCLEVAIFHRAGADEVPSASSPAESGCVTEKWYRGRDGFPDEAFRDAAEWLASPSRRRD